MSLHAAEGTERTALPLSRLYTRFSVHNRVLIIAFIIDHDVVDAILRHLAKAEARSPRGPPSAAALPAAS